MKTRIKIPLLLLFSAGLCLATSCGPKGSERETNGEENTEIENIEQENSVLAETIKEEVEALEEESSVSGSTLKICSEEPIKGPGQWDPSSKMYNDDPRHLFWDLSFYQNWNTFDGVCLPKPVQLVVENADNGILAALAAFPLVDNNITSVWQLPKEAVVNEVMTVWNKLFKQAQPQEPFVSKVNFRNKSAYEISFKADVPDQRSGERVTRQYSIRMVTMVSDGEIIELMVMAPPAGLERFGDDIFNMLMGKFNFVDPS